MNSKDKNTLVFDRLDELERLLYEEPNPNRNAFYENRKLFENFLTSLGDRVRIPAIGITHSSIIQAFWKIECNDGFLYSSLRVDFDWKGIVYSLISGNAKSPFYSYHKGNGPPIDIIPFLIENPMFKKIILEDGN